LLPQIIMLAPSDCAHVFSECLPCNLVVLAEVFAADLCNYL